MMNPASTAVARPERRPAKADRIPNNDPDGGRNEHAERGVALWLTTIFAGSSAFLPALPSDRSMASATIRMSNRRQRMPLPH
jgi:hypothetical protein